MTPTIEGALFGGLLIFLIGPVFFALIQTSIQHGFVAGTVFALGVWISDAALLLLSWYGISQIAERDAYLLWLGLAGGTALVGFGLYSIFNAGPSQIYGVTISPGSVGSTFLKGLALNGLNPMVVIFWSGVVGYELINYDHGLHERIYFFIGVLLTMAGGDIAKAYFASRLRKVLNPKLVATLNKGVGILLVFFGGRLLYHSLSISL